ncbi:unnamed protein product [Vitrella brassicaformis CCMP3155]|uniref:Uncharacterized protein n=1 Tax=Vitrella brassicaformis (strain CCMP3155) TaxID=1169540 RepID=A0A0G4H7I6_VITBC|nr:unnamed protein product [Vitrella brassicaformis CCMP3155]|eukprot:CEM39712.1 unnamed protein product [Vitrella brassicaformis CCMP3155]
MMMTRCFSLVILVVGLAAVTAQRNSDRQMWVGEGSYYSMAPTARRGRTAALTCMVRRFSAALRRSRPAKLRRCHSSSRVVDLKGMITSSLTMQEAALAVREAALAAIQRGDAPHRRIRTSRAAAAPRRDDGFLQQVH